MSDSTYEIWVGAYAEREQVGITRLRMDAETGAVDKLAEFTGIENPSFLAMDRSRQYLYAVSETDNGEVVAFELKQEGEAAQLHEAVSHETLGGAPCFLMLDANERWLAVSNYNGPSVILYDMLEGGLPGPANVRFRHSGTGPNAERQEMAHPHSAVFSPDGKFLFVPDLGMDKIMVYALDEEGKWAGYDAVSLPSGAGPRHFKFHPSGKTAFVVNELDCTVTRFTYDAEQGKLAKQESLPTLPASFQGENTCAELAVSPDGRFVYASNRGHDSIAIFHVGGADGELESAGFVSTRGQMPRHFAISPDGRWLLAANQQSGSLVVFRVDAESGLPIYAGTELAIEKPVCVFFR